MSSSSSKTSETNTSSDSVNTPDSAHPAPFVSPELLLSLATAPVLLAIVSGKAFIAAVQELGVLSEEIFRGDRLPVLHFPSEPQPNPDDSTTL